MKSVAELGMQSWLNPCCHPKSVLDRVRAPVQRASDDVVSSKAVGVVVAPGFHDIDLTAGGPGPIGVRHRHHPDCRPQPVALGDLGMDFNPSICDACTEFSIDAAGLDWLDDRPVVDVGVRHAVKVNIRSRCTGTGGGKIDCIVCGDEDLVLQCRPDV